MHTAIFEYISRHSQTPLSHDEVELIKASWVMKKLKKKHFLLQRGDVCQYTGFIVKGAMRQYSVDVQGTGTEAALARPSALVVLTARGDNGSDLFHIGESSTAGYRLFMFGLPPATVDALGRTPVRMSYVMDPGGPPVTFAVDFTVTEGEGRDPTGPGRFADCLKAL